MRIIHDDVMVLATFALQAYALAYLRYLWHADAGADLTSFLSYKYSQTSCYIQNIHVSILPVTR